MVTSIQDFVLATPQWIMGEGESTGIILSSRARLARNLTALPFVHRTKKSDLVRIITKVESAVRTSTMMSQSLFIPIPETPDLDRQFLVERRLISPGLAEAEKTSGAFITPHETVSLMVNEEDHLRIQSLRNGLQLEAVWQEADKIDTELSQSLDFAFSDDFGYLTACPTNVGTGIRVSVLIHLPGLVLTDNIDPVIRGMTGIGLAVRGLYGEGTDALGDLYQLSNQRTLGYSELDIVTNLDRVVRQLIRYEERAYETLLREASAQIEDRVWRAYGLLCHARMLSSHDAVEALSSIRMGLNVGIINIVDLSVLNRLLIMTQSAHVQKIAGHTLDTEAQDVMRADLVRQHLNPSPTSIRQQTDHST